MVKKKSMKLSKYFQIIRPEYVYIKLTPNNSIRNYNSDKIAKAIHQLYKTIGQRIKKEDKKFFYEAPSKVSYYMYIEKTKAEFYFIVPKVYLSLIKEKIRDTWKGITINDKVEKIPTFSPEAYYYQLSYKKEDPLSLATDKRTNTLLSSALNVLEVMEEGDRVGIFYNFCPTTQRPWRTECERTFQKVKENQPIDREKLSFKYIATATALMGIELGKMLTDIFGSLIGAETKKDNTPSALELALTQITKKDLSAATVSKKEKTVLNTQILVLSDSNDKHRKNNNAVSVCEAFKSLSEDGGNELIYKKVKTKKPIDVHNFQLPIDTIKTSVDECQNFLALPGRELLEEHGSIEKIDTTETEVPEELRQGVMCIGTNTYRGKSQLAYLTTDKEYKNLTLTVVGPTRAGKTTLFQNLTKNAIDNGECVVIPDFISWCKMSHEISQVIPKEKILVIDCEDYKKLPGFGFNELWIETEDPIERYDSAKRQTAQLLILVNGVNEDLDLRAKMERYLESAALVVFSCNGSMKDVFEVLQNHKKRHEYIPKVPVEIKGYLDEYIENLLELDEWSKETQSKPSVIVGTKLSLVSGIIDRVSRLKRNTAMEIMLKKDCSDNINLLEELQKPQLIIIRMPDSRFSTQEEKDFMCTYWLSKLWLTLQLRDTLIKDRSKRVKVNILFDELYQIPHTQTLLKEKLSQIAKFDAKPIISCHYLGQIGIIRNELKSANSSYMLLQGCDKDNFKELKEELESGGYCLEDLLNLKPYNSLNLIKYEKGYSKFITLMPPEIFKSKKGE